MSKRIWWATWPGALAMGLLSLLLLLPAGAAGAITFLIADTGSTGIDFDAGTTPLGMRIFAGLAIAATVALPVLVIRWARKKWLGYLLLGQVLSLVIGAVGLGLFGII